MVNIEKYNKFLQYNISLDHYLVLVWIYRGEVLPPNRKIKGFRNLLELKGYLQSGIITEKGLELVHEEVFENSLTTTTTLVPASNPFDEFVNKLLLALKSTLKEHIGKEQLKGFGNVYFIPSIGDLREFLQRFDKKYRLLQGNEDKITKILVNHVVKCAKEKSFSPAIKYFICKDGSGSQLAAALENYQETEIEIEKVQNELLDRNKTTTFEL